MAVTNLGFLRMFDAVMRHRSVTGAAQELRVTQPAISNALARLREETGDGLVVRGSRGLEPTPFALSYHRSVAAALELLDGGLQDRPDFDPDRDRRHFVIAMADIAEAFILSRVFSRHFRARPTLSISTRPVPAQQIGDALATGAIDLAIGYFGRLQGPLVQQTLLQTRYVDLGIGAPREPARYCIVEGSGTGHEAVARRLEAHLGHGSVAMRLPHFLAVPHLLKDAGLRAIVPEPLVGLIGDWPGVGHRPPPCRLPAVSIRMVSHSRVRTDPAHQWLRGAFRESFVAERAAQSTAGASESGHRERGARR